MTANLPRGRDIPAIFNRTVWLGRFRTAFVHQRQPSSQIIWNKIQLLSEVQEKGVELFDASTTDPVKCWEGLNNFARQGHAYSSALDAVTGTARGLLGYYGALNLAKAELLHHCPDDVIDQKIGHGLSFPVGKSFDVESDYVTVQDGIFPRLYEARTGRSIAKNERFPISCVLSQIPEISDDYREVFDSETHAYHGTLQIAADGNEFWPILLLEDIRRTAPSAPGYSELESGFQEIELPDQWSQIFSVSNRDPAHFRCFEAKSMFRGGVAEPPTGAIDMWTDDHIGALLDTPTERYQNAIITFKPKSDSDLPLPSFLARYVAMFYLSSLVRYQPGRLNPSNDRLTVWLMENFAHETPIHLLIDAYDGITQSIHLYDVK